MSKRLPTTTSSFRDIIEGDYLYVDKTKYIYDLVHLPKGAWFLSRPRRFGKSLFISTLEELFQGNRELFQGLWIDNSDYHWEANAVIRLDFSLYPSSTAEELQSNIKRYLAFDAQRHGVSLQDGPHYAQFGDLILALSVEKQVIILIDEYDKPLIDNLDNLPEAQKILSTLKGFYGVIKALDRYIRMSFITGISKFSKVGVFSDLNNLTDLTLNTAFATALGLTETEIRQNLSQNITLFAEKEDITEDTFIEQMHHWYNGFCFAPEAENVYNPFSTLHLFYNQRFSNYWFESGSPSFLIKLIREGNFDLEELSNLELSELAFSTYEIDKLSIIPLLFQTGYLTIKAYYPDSQGYQLGYPNFEVENAFMVYLLDAFSNTQQGLSDAHLRRLIDALRNHDLALFFKLIGLRISAEVKTNDGRIDSVVELDDRIYLFEFKLDKSAQIALDQMDDHAYYQKYQLHGKPIACVGVNFDTQTRTVDDWKSTEFEHL
ncbi:ATP-binding protein [Chloroflexi bacterium TSY]|nr:ATP-binding protein [Chloroflexi bacterium TSY]